MFRDVTEPYHQDHRTLQAFTSLLTLVEALTTITEQGESASCAEAENVPPDPLAAAGKSFAMLAQQVLDCKYVGVFALDPPDDRQRMLGTSGLSPEEEEILLKDTNQTPLADYVNAEVIAKIARRSGGYLGSETTAFPHNALSPRSTLSTGRAYDAAWTIDWYVHHGKNC